jgi:hypothetical protein
MRPLFEILLAAVTGAAVIIALSRELDRRFTEMTDQQAADLTQAVTDLDDALKAATDRIVAKLDALNSPDPRIQAGIDEIKADVGKLGELVPDVPPTA